MLCQSVRSTSNLAESHGKVLIHGQEYFNGHRLQLTQYFHSFVPLNELLSGSLKKGMEKNEKKKTNQNPKKKNSKKLIKHN